MNIETILLLLLCCLLSLIEVQGTLGPAPHQTKNHQVARAQASVDIAVPVLGATTAAMAMTVATAASQGCVAWQT